MRVALVGAGAIGGCIASRLARSGQPVSLLVRPGQVATLNAHGLRMREHGAVHATRHVASADGAALGPQDLVFLCVKGHGLRPAAAQIAPLVGPHTTIVSALNGIPWWFFDGLPGPLHGRQLQRVDPDGLLARQLPAAQTVGCVVYVAAHVDAEGVVTPAPGDKLVLGDAVPGSGRAAAVVERLRAAGFAPEMADSVHRETLVKLWGNLAANPIGALSGATIDAVLQQPLLAQLATRMMEEFALLAGRLGLDLGMDVAQRQQGMRRLAGVKSSMQQDMEAGRALELDGIVGAVAEIGDLLGVDTPFIDAVQGLLQQRAAQAGLWSG
ncbi:ketopantoate reductase family protein [Pseudorhodoferax sp.]|uniref:ketopantoate reductase family protein n=1 Tax=Pseudorhodoferax sp. TaxID=1993553 RepID=UPI002DD67672|nr:2-dehydropantoate 2-reductase [Pseudorhodoferax sp.]